MRSWVDLYPQRLEFEVAELKQLGFEADEFELRRNRRLVMSGAVTTVRGEVRLVIAYPDTFPYMRPEVYAPDLRLERHQNIYETNLCLLDRATAQWQVDDTGAWLVRERVPLLFRLLEAGGDTLAAAEAQQGEPMSTYFAGRPGTAVFVPEAALNVDPAERSGMFELAFSGGGKHSVRLRALLKRVTVKGGRHGRVLAKADDLLSDRFGPGLLQGRWVRLDRLPDMNTASALLEAAAEVAPEIAKPRFRPVNGAQVAVVGCVFSDEVGQGHFEDNWLFVVVHRQTSGAAAQQGAFIVRGERLTRRSMMERTPSLATLGDKHVAILGLGGIGAAIALELARAGVGRLSLLDGDNVELGNTARWPFGLSAVGHRKVDVVGGWIANEYPYTQVDRLDGRIGSVGNPNSRPEPRERSELDSLANFVGDADLVIDATAELGVQHLVTLLAGHRPQLYAWATEGAAGGAVVRIDGNRGCWLCLQHALDDGSVSLPPADAHATIQPLGCASTTFTGAAFDLAPVSNQAVRVAVATLLNQSSPEQDVSVFSLRALDGTTLPAPRWHSQPLEAHSACAACGSRQAA